eukprot:173688_1
MLHILLFISVLVDGKANVLRTEISDQLSAVKGHCVDSFDFGNTYDSLGTNLENNVTSITITATNSDTTTDSISGFTEDLGALQSSTTDYQPLQQELLITLNKIRSIIQDARTEMDILVAFAHATPDVTTKITGFESDADNEVNNIDGTIDIKFRELKNNFNAQLQRINDGMNDGFSEPQDYA